MNYQELSDNMLKLLIADGGNMGQRAQVELTRRADEQLLKDREAANAKLAESYIRRRGGAPHVPNRKTRGQ